MANPARDFRNAAQAKWPGAVVVGRTRNGIKHQHPTDPNRFMVDSSIGPVHIRNTETEIDTAIEAVAENGFQYRMVLADYNVHFRNTFNVGNIFEYRDPDTDEWVIFDPQSINWIDENTSRQQIAIKQAVAAQVNDDVVSFPEAYGAGRHFQYQAQTGRLQKLITIDSLSDLPTPTVQGNEIWFEAEFSLSTSAGVDLYLDGVKWAKTNGVRVQTSDRIEFRDAATGQQVFWYLDFPRAWDSDDNQIIGQMEVRRQGGSYFITVRIPYTWIQNATFPIYIDPTVDTGIGTGANDGFWTEGVSGFSNSSVALDFGDKSAPQEVANIFAMFTLTGPGSGDTIDVSYITVRSRVSKTINVYTDISCGAVDDASAPTDYNGAETASKTASVAWDVSTMSNNSYYTTPSLNTPTQAVVDRAGWVSGQDIIYYIENDGAATADGDYYTVDAYEQSTSDCPQLHIEYTAGGGGATIALSTAAITAGGQALTLAPGTATTSLNTASITANGQSLTLSPGAAITALATAALTANGISATIVPGAVSIPLNTATATLSGQTITISILSGITIALNTATATASGQAITILPGEYTLNLSTGQITANGQALTLAPGAVTIGLNTAALTTNGQALTIVPGAVSINLSTGQIVISGQSISIGSGIAINLNTATIAASGQSLSLSLGQVITALNTASLAANGQSISLVPGEAITALDTAIINAAGQGITLVPGGVAINLDTANLSAGGQNIVLQSIIAVVKSWTLHNRSIDWTLDERTNTLTLKPRSTDWTLEDDDR